MKTDLSINRMLQAAFKEKQKLNPRFSIRAYADQLGIDNSTLAQILKGKRRVGPRLARVLEARLGVSLVQHAARRKKKTSKKKQIFEELSLDFKAPPPWYYLAVLEYLQLSPSAESLESAAAQVGVLPSDMAHLVRWFETQGWIRQGEDNRKRPVEKTQTFLSPPMTNAVAKNHQLAALEASKRALLDKSFNERIHNALYFNFSSRDLPALRRRFDQFMDDIALLSQKKKSRATGSYCLSLSAFPVIESGV
jgi:transcriptional regulator with XRE-family HTH domain